MKKRTLKDLHIKALKYKTRGELQKYDFNTYQIIVKRKLLDKICSHMPKRIDQSGKNNPRFKWTKEKIQKEANKYKTRKDFKKNSSRAYNAACDKKILNQVCKKMLPVSNRPYTLAEIKQEALKYKTIKDFRSNNVSLYSIAWKRGVLDQICSHMIRAKISSPEKTILEEIKKYYPNAKKFLAKKLNIIDKSYIKKLEIDILIPELNKGIEFDGRYHHSFEGLKRGHPTWKEEDIKNYHQIKDDAFENLGIKILHIKENDWRKNSKDCIKKCLNFLKGDLCQ
jgi:hypothetical protein